jgi:hypothetical protein
MSRICPSCGNDAGFDVARCPNCGSDMTGSPSQPAGSSGDPATGAWEKTVVEPVTPRVNRAGRLRFDQGREFYEAIDETHMGPSADSVESETSDATVVERARPPMADDATVIIRSGRRGVAGPLAYLVERTGVRAGKVHLLGRETNIGRAPEGEVVLGDESVSKRHAKIRMEEGKFVFWDLASTNYSRLVAPDGSRSRIIEPRPLEDGDTFDLGEARLTFLLVEPEGAGDDEP